MWREQQLGRNRSPTYCQAAGEATCFATESAGEATCGATEDKCMYLGMREL